MVMFLEAAGLVTREILPVNEGQSRNQTLCKLWMSLEEANDGGRIHKEQRLL